MRTLLATALCWTMLATDATAAPTATERNAPVGAPFILEHSYWLEPGQTGRFIELLNRNKIPLLQREMAEGRILWMRTTRPRLSSADPKQPDFRLTIAWRDSVAAWDDLDPSRFIPTVVKDEVRWRSEEAEREKLVVSRADVPVQETMVER